MIRRGVHHLADAVLRARVGAAIAESYREHPQTSDDDALAMARHLWQSGRLPKSVLTVRLGVLGVDARRQICEALDAVAGC